jgi:hypothetical protein
MSPPPAIEDRHSDRLAWFARDPAFRAEFAHDHYLRPTGPTTPPFNKRRPMA